MQNLNRQNLVNMTNSNTQNQMVIFTFSVLGKFGPKNKNRQFNLKFGTYNHFYNILRLLDVLPNFHFTTSEMMGDYYLYTWYIRVASPVAERLKT